MFPRSGSQRACFVFLAELLIATVVIATGCGGAAHTPPPVTQPEQPELPGVAKVFESLTYKYDNSRIGLNDHETTLTRKNVNSAQFGKLMVLNVDGFVFAQPLYVSKLDLGPQGVHNVIFVATEHDSVYAFDADARSSTPLWQRSFLDAAHGISSVPNTNVNDPGGRTALGPEVGITGTPVIDRTTQTLYVSAMTMEQGTAVHKLHALDLATGAEKSGGPKLIAATVSGRGAGNDGKGNISFLGLRQNQRAGLLLVQGIVYVVFGSFSDVQPYHGWIFAFDTATLEQLGAFLVTPNSEGGSIWQGGAAPAADEQGDIYVMTADGGFDADTGGTEYGDSLLRLSFRNRAFTVKDWFTPYNQNCLNRDDLDLGSGGPALLPGGFSDRRLVAAGSKEGRLYLVDRDNMGFFRSAGDTQILDWVLINPIPCDIDNPDFTSPQAANTRRIYGSVGFFNGSLYVGTANGTLKAYQVSNNKMTFTSESANTFLSRGPIPVVTANGTAEAIVWIAERRTDTGQAILRAYDAADLAKELYNSNQAGSRDALGKGVVFTVPLVINGKAYVAAQKQVAIFGSLPQ